jgi:ectoine hydroxylase-related dioxygenase (phytanoyl-CoA dioxygenase family)
MLDNKKWSLSSFEDNGFALVEHVVSDVELNELTESIDELLKDAGPTSPGVRHLMKRSSTVRRIAKSQALCAIATSVIGENARPVKAILFDKTPAANWYVTWHQDLTIAVEERIDVSGFGPWSIKDGLPHVQPPAEVLGRMVALRLHLDDCPEDNGAINFIPGSHADGILNPPGIESWRNERESICCAADRGDVIAMKPLILHKSSQSRLPTRRRVLHLEYCADELPGGLQWAEASGLGLVR